MALLSSRPYAFLAVAAALFGEGSSSVFASALGTTVISTCDDFANLPSTAMTEDVDLRLNSTTFTCDEVTTVTANGPYKFEVIGNNRQTDFTKVRFEVSGGASVRFASMISMITALTFTGVTELGSDGAVFNVELGSSLELDAMSTFEHNSVQAGYSGGAIYAGGEVVLNYVTTFNENSVLSDDNLPSGSGGALFVKHGGAVVIRGDSAFTYNNVGGGGQGGAVANFGSLVFPYTSSHTSFTDNAAQAFTSAAGDSTGGHGGAIFTGDSGVTSIIGLEYASHNSAARGGAIYNEGSTLLMSTTEGATPQFSDNDATGGDTGNGGHIFTSGLVYAEDACQFTYGHATGNGGAVYIDVEGTFTSAGGATFVSNTADGECDDVYASGETSLCQASFVAGLGKAVKP